MLIPATPTIWELPCAIEAYAGGHVKIMGGAISAPTLSVLIGQGGLETGMFGANDPAHPSMFDHNAGNVRPGSDWEGDTCQYSCTEVINGKIMRYAPPAPESTFRAYASPADGAAEQVKFLATRTRYALAWHWACQGNASQFVRALALGGYFTGDPRPYANAVSAISKRVLPACESWLAGDGHTLTDDDREHVAGLVAITLRAQEWLPNAGRHDDA